MTYNYQHVVPKTSKRSWKAAPDWNLSSTAQSVLSVGPKRVNAKRRTTLARKSAILARPMSLPIKRQAKSKDSVPRWKANATIRNWQTSRMVHFHQEAHFGKIRVFRALNRKMSRPCSPPRSPKDARYPTHKNLPIQPFLKNGLALSIVWVVSKSFGLSMIVFAIYDLALTIW